MKRITVILLALLLFGCDTDKPVKHHPSLGQFGKLSSEVGLNCGKLAELAFAQLELQRELNSLSRNMRCLEATVSVTASTKYDGVCTVVANKPTACAVLAVTTEFNEIKDLTIDGAIYICAEAKGMNSSINLHAPVIIVGVVKATGMNSSIKKICK